MSNKLANCFLIGAQKAGTTSVCEYLNQHPDIYMPIQKEIAFFLVKEKYEKGLSFLGEEFFSKAENRIVRLDPSIQYMVVEEVAERIKSSGLDLDDVYFYAILRHPVKRAHSSYWQAVSEGIEERSFSEAIRNEQDTMLQKKEQGERWWRWGYAWGGLYSKHLSVYRRAFGKDKIRIFLMDDVNKDPGIFCKQVLKDYGLSEDFEFDFSKVSNVASVPKNKLINKVLFLDSPLRDIVRKLVPHGLRFRIGMLIKELNSKTIKYDPMDDVTELFLKEYYKSDLEELEKMLAVDLSAWKS